ncbi:MAG: sodium:solute symporter family protein [Deltaproteobacteria bacterium]|nr:sodium:solute symporter family protein [Deltaproteobacteria bacterium]
MAPWFGGVIAQGPMRAAVFSFSPLDLAVVGLFLLAVLTLGLRLGRRAGPAEEFLLAGRRLTLPMFVGSLVSTWYGGILGVGEIAFSDGVVTWVTQGGFWYLSYFVFAFFLAERLSRSKQVTLPDQLGLLHGPRARVVASLLNFLNVVPVAYMLSMGLVAHLILGCPVWLGTVLGATLVLGYSALGGFRAVVYTDLLQFALMCVAVALLMIFAVVKLGGSDYLTLRLPPAHLQPRGHVSGQELFVWALIALSTLVDPNFYQRCYAALTPRVARLGVLCSIGFWMLFDVCTTFTGLYARAALPTADPRLAYPLLANRLLPPGVKGIFFVGLLATVMGTVDSYCFVAATTLSHDFFRRTLRPDATDETVVRTTRWALLFTVVLAVLLSLASGGSIKGVWKTLGSLSTSALLVPMLLGQLGWRPRGAGLAAMLAGAGGTLGWAALRRFGPPWARRLEVMVPGLGLSLSAYAGAGLLSRGGKGTP